MSIRSRSFCTLAITVAILVTLLASGVGTVASPLRATQVLVLLYALGIAAAGSSQVTWRHPVPVESLFRSSLHFSVTGVGRFSRPFLC